MNQDCILSDSTSKHITIVGPGPARLFASYLLLESGFFVDLYDHSSGVGKSSWLLEMVG